MTLQELAEYVCDKVGPNDSETMALAKRMIQRRYQMIWDSHLWSDSLVLQPDLSAVNGIVTLPHKIDRIVALRWGQFELPPINTVNVFQLHPRMLDETGIPVAFVELSPVATLIPPLSEPMVLVSSSASDTGLVTVRGELNGIEVEETINLNGLTPVITANSYDVALMLSKGATAGTVTVKSTGGLVLQTLLPGETERKHVRLKLIANPTATESLLALGKRRLSPLVNPNDTPALRSIDNALLAFAQADLLERQRQYAKAQAKVAEAAGLMDTMRALEASQNASITRIVPVVESMGYDYTMYLTKLG